MLIQGWQGEFSWGFICKNIGGIWGVYVVNNSTTTKGNISMCKENLIFDAGIGKGEYSRRFRWETCLNNGKFTKKFEKLYNL